MFLLAPTRIVRPLQLHSELLRGRLYRHGLLPAVGAAWLDEPGQDDVLVRTSVAIGIPGALPDVHALAVRIPVAGSGTGDLLFTGSGWSRISRYVPRPQRSVPGRSMPASLAYRTPGGAVLLRARANGAESFELACATSGGEFRVFADLRLSRSPVEEEVSFDPDGRPLPGLEPVRGARSA